MGSLRDYNGVDCVSPVRSQGNSAHCYAYAVVAGMEARFAAQDVHAGITLALSEADLVLKANGAAHPKPTLQAAQSKGVLLRVCHFVPACAAGAETHSLRPQYEFVRGVRKIQQSIDAGRPVVGVMTIFENFEAVDDSGIYLPQGDPVGAHAVCIIGYDGAEDEADGHWIIKNSYGPEWGDKGFFYMAYNEDDAGLENSAYAIKATV